MFFAARHIVFQLADKPSSRIVSGKANRAPAATAGLPGQESCALLLTTVQ